MCHPRPDIPEQPAPGQRGIHEGQKPWSGPCNPVSGTETGAYALYSRPGTETGAYACGSRTGSETWSSPCGSAAGTGTGPAQRLLKLHLPLRLPLAVLGVRRNIRTIIVPKFAMGWFELNGRN